MDGSDPTIKNYFLNVYFFYGFFFTHCLFIGYLKMNKSNGDKQTNKNILLDFFH